MKPSEFKEYMTWDEEDVISITGCERDELEEFLSSCGGNITELASEMIAEMLADSYFYWKMDKEKVDGA